MSSMTNRLSWFAAAALLGGPLAGTLAATPVSAEELVFGSWTSPKEYQNVQVMPKIFKEIEEETKGAIKWKLIPGGAIADGKTTFSAVKDGLMQGGLGIVTYSPSTIPSVFTIYSTVVLGHNDVVAASAAALEVLYQRCPSCLDELRKNNSVALGGWTSSAYILACTSPVKSPSDLKGKRVRATAGNAELMRAAGGAPVAVTLVEAVTLLQRGGLDCQHGVADWLKTFGYADFTKYVADQPLGITGPALGWLINRDTWNKFTPEQKQVHLKHAAWMSAKQAIGNFIISNEEVLAALIKDKGVTQLKSDPKEWEVVIAEFRKGDRERNIEAAKKLGVPDPGALIDDYLKTIEKWRGKSEEVGRDIDKLADVLMKEIFSKIDLATL
jgi:TRAP-type C4-dicarboxylate transport system substrate-binding protein